MELTDLYTSKTGRKSARLRTRDTHESLSFITKSDMICPFGLSSFEKNGGRLSLAISCTDDRTREFFEEIDRWAPTYLEEHSERLFGRRMSAEQVAMWYRPCIKATNYDPVLNTKVGPETCFWDADKRRTIAPEDPLDWRKRPARFKLSIPMLWIMPGSCGFMVNVEHVLFAATAVESAPTCPF